MKFHNQTKFKGRTIANTIDKPILHKKGKQWLVMSAFTLALLGGTSVAQANASQVQGHTTMPNSAVNVQTQAGQMHKQLLTNSTQQKPVNGTVQPDTKPNVKVNLKLTPNQNSQNKNNPSNQLQQTKQDNGQGFINPKNRDNDVDNNPDAHYNFESSDKMYDTQANDYLNNVNHLTHDKDGEAIRPQMEVTYAWNGHEQDKRISVPKINSNIIQELNSRQIGVLPLYNPGISMRGDDEFPSDNELRSLENYTDPQASLGYQPEKIVPYRLVGYLFTAPRNTEFTDLFAKYFYPKTDNGYALDDDNSYFSYPVNKTTVAGAHVLPKDLRFDWENNTSTDYSEHDGTYINLEYKAQTNKITFIDKKTGKTVGQWTSSKTGSSKDFNWDLYNFYVNISSPSTYSKSNIVIPSGYALENSDMVKFHNTVYPPKGGYGTNFNFGHNYVIPLSKPDNDTITYTYNGKKIGGWTSKTEGTTDSENHELVNIYNIITSTNAPGLPKGYWIPNGPKFGENTFAYNNYPLEKFLNTLYPAVGDIKGFNYGKHFVIPVSLINPTKKSKITVDYIDKQSNRTLKSQSTTGAVGNTFDIGHYLSNLPAGYNYAGLQNTVTSFAKGPQTVKVFLDKEPQAKVAKSTITVNDVDNMTGKVIRKAGSDTEDITTPFDISQYLSIPNGYQYVGIKNNVNDFDYDDHTVDVLLKKVTPAKVAQSTITINDVDAKTGQLIKKAGSDTGNITTPFDVSKYLSIPNGYSYAGIRGNVTSFDYDNHTVDILLSKVRPAKVAKSTITVNFLNSTTGDLVEKAGSDTENITTPFSYNKYLNRIPKGYQYAGVKDNTDSFGYDDHTVNVLLSKVVPEKPSSASSATKKPASKASIKPSSASSASSAAPKSKAPSKASSSASQSTKPSSASQSVKPSSKAQSKASSASQKPSAKISSASSKTTSAKSQSASQSAQPSSTSSVPASKASSAGSKVPSSMSKIPSSSAVKPSHNSSASSTVIKPKSSTGHKPLSSHSSSYSSSVQPSSADKDIVIPSSYSRPSSYNRPSYKSMAMTQSSASTTNVQPTSNKAEPTVNPKIMLQKVSHQKTEHVKETKIYRPKNWFNFVSGVNHARQGMPMHIRNVDYRYGYYGFKYAKRAQYRHSKLPQTNETNHHMSLMAAIMLVLSFGFTLADVVKHEYD